MTLENNFWIDLIASLKKAQSKKQIKSDIKTLGDLYIKLIGKLDLTKTRQNIKNQLKGINSTEIKLSPTVSRKDIQARIRQMLKEAQTSADKNKIKYGIELDRQKLVNELKILGRNNSNLFKNSEMSAKYDKLIDSAKIAKSKEELRLLRKEMSAFKTELVATNNAGLTWTDKFKASISRFTQYFSGATFMYTLISQIRNATNEAKNLDDALVDLQKVTDEITDRNSLYEYFDRAMDKAQELNVKVDSLLYAVTEFKKLGWDLSAAEIGGEWATILENVGDVNIDTAIGSIKTAIASFDEIGGFTDAQMDKKIEAYVDLINNMSNKYSIDAEGLSEAIRLSAGTLREAHTSIEEAATIFATANRYYNDPDYLGNTLKIGSLRMRASTGDDSAKTELEEMGEEIEELSAATSTLRDKLLLLTGVDIMVDEHTFKSYYDQLYEISQVIDSLNDTSRANVLETLFGKNRSAAGAAILSGMKESAGAYEDAVNSMGSATQEYETWMESADAASQRFANNLTKTYQSIINGNTVRDVANLGSAVLDFANDLGIVEGTLKGILILGIGKFITTTTMAMLTAAKSVEQYGRAWQLANSIPDNNLSARFTYLKGIAQATFSLTDAQLKQVLSAKALNYQDQIRILRISGMSKELAEQRLRELGLTQAVNAQTAANTANMASTFSLKAAVAGLGQTIKTAFLNNPIGVSVMALSVVIGAVTSKISQYNEEIKETMQNNIDNAKSFTDSIKNIQKETADMEKSINSIIDRYAELSQGVNAFTNENKSLPTEQYEEFLGLNKQLTELFPSLTRNYDENGNAILGLSGSVDSVTESIRFLVEQEKELAKAQIRENLEKYFNGTDEADGAWKVLEGKKQELENANEALTALKDTYEGLINTDTSAIIGQYHKDFVQAEKAKYIEYIKDSFGDDIATAMEDAVSIHLGKGLGGQFADIVVDFSSLELTEEQKEQIARSYDTFYSELLAKQKTAMSEFESQNSEFSSNAMFWLEDLSFYKDSDKYIQTAIQNLVRNIDWTDYNPEELDYEGIKRILQDSVLTPFQTACEDQNTKDALNDALKGLFSLDMSDMPVTNVKAQVDSYIDTIAAILGEEPLELKIKFGFDNADDTVQKLSNSIYGIANDGNSKFKVNSQDYLTLIKYTKGFNAEQAELWLKATLGINGAANAILAYENALKSADNEQSDLLSPTISSTIDQLNTQLKPAFDALKEAYLDIFTTDDNGKEVFTLENVDLSMLDEIKSAIDDLNSNEDLGIYIDYSSFDNLANVLTDTKSTAEDVHNAINAFAGEIIQSLNPSLGETTEETYQFTQAMLKSLGVMNSEEVMAAALGYSLEELAELKRVAADVGYDLTDKTEEEISDFITEQVEAGNCSEALYLLALKKELLNRTAINTASDIEYILGLAQSAGIASDALVKLADAKAMLETATAKGDTRGIYEAKKYARELQGEIRNDIVSFEIPEIKFEPSSDSKDSASKAGKKVADAYLEAFEKELERLQEMRDRGEITEKKYLDQLRKLYQKYFKDRKKYLDEYAKYEYEYLDGMRSLYQRVMGGISDIIDKQSDKYGEQKDAAVESYKAQQEAAEESYDAQIDAIDAQIDAIDAEIDAIDKEIDAKNEAIDAIQKEIDKIREAREERQKQIDLQKKQYELERMQNQRTDLVYTSEKGMIYRPNEQGIRDAREEVDEAKEELYIMQLEKQISLIEEEIDALEKRKDILEDQKDSLDKQKSALEELKKSSSEYYDEMIEKTEKFYDGMIKALEDYKSRWDELAELEDQAKMMNDIEQLLSQYGYTVDDITNMSEDAFNAFKEDYLSILNDLYSENSSMQSAIAEQAGTTTDALGSYIAKTEEYINSLAGIDLSSAEQSIDNVSTAMDNVASSADTANQKVSQTVTNMSSLNASTSGVSSDLTTVSQTLNTMPNGEGINNLATGFTNLATAIGEVTMALGLTEEDTIGGLLSTLKSINDITFEGEEGEGIIGQFDKLKTAINEVTTAIAGGGETESGEKGSGNGNQKKAGGEKSGGESGKGESEGGADSLVGAINAFSEAVTEETEVAIDAFDQHTDKLTNEVIPAIQAATEEMNAFNAAADKDIEKTITITYSVVGNPSFGGAANVEGTAHVEGTAKVSGDWGVQQGGKSLVGETGRELIVRKGRFFTVGDNGAEFIDLQKGDIIFNHTQTEKLLKDGKISSRGRALANGTMVEPDGTIHARSGDLIPINSPAFQKLDPKTLNIDPEQFQIYKKIGEISQSLDLGVMKVQGINQMMSDMVSKAVNNDVVTNNNNNPKLIVNGGINLTCPGVTSQEVLKNAKTLLENEFSGLALKAYQQSKITR